MKFRGTKHPVEALRFAQGCEKTFEASTHRGCSNQCTGANIAACCSGTLVSMAMLLETYVLSEAAAQKVQICVYASCHKLLKTSLISILLVHPDFQQMRISVASCYTIFVSGRRNGSVKSAKHNIC
jgi:hypothetical protein